MEIANSKNFNIAKTAYDKYILPLELTYYKASVVADSGYKSKTPEQTIKDGFGFCTEQVEVAEIWLKESGISKPEKYQLFAVPKHDIYDVKIDLSHAFIGIPDNENWILFETGFRARNRGGVRNFADREGGFNYVLKLYNQSLQVANITGLILTLYKYEFPAENLTFQEFSKKVMADNNRIALDTENYR